MSKKAIIILLLILAVAGSGLAEEKLPPKKKIITKDTSEVIRIVSIDPNGVYKHTIYYVNNKEIARETMVQTELKEFDDSIPNYYLKLTGKIPDGSVKEYYSNGKIKYDATYKNNKAYGLWKEYYDNGQLESIWDGGTGSSFAPLVKEYYDNGQLKYFFDNVSDKPNYTISNYYKNGNNKEISYYSNTAKVSCKFYYEDGALQKEEYYKDDKLSGLIKSYYSNGDIYIIDTYKKGVKINKKIYDESGKETLNQEYPYEAVFTDDNIEQGLSDTLTTSFYKTKMFVVLERSKMKEILKEQKFQLTGCTKTECAVEIGKILNVQYMVIGSIAKIGKTYTVNIRIVNVENSEVVIADMEKCENETDLIDTIKKIVEGISGKKAFGIDSRQNTIAILDLATKKE